MLCCGGFAQYVPGSHYSITMIEEDKRQHAWVCFVLVWIFWLWSLATRRRWLKDSLSLSTLPKLPMILVLIAGAAKEGADAVSNTWPWCHPICAPDGYEMVAKLVGVIIGGISIALFQVAVAIIIVGIEIPQQQNDECPTPAMAPL